jgi:hypothetical protein
MPAKEDGSSKQTVEDCTPLAKVRGSATSAAMRRKLLIALFVLLVFVIAFVLWPAPRYTLSRVDPTLRGLATPYQSVNLVDWSDGSIGIRILDKDGKQLKLALPVSLVAGKPTYRHLFLGAERSTDPGATEVAFSEDTRQMLFATLEEYRRFSDSTDLILLRFRGDPIDSARFYGGAVAHGVKSKIE